MNRDELIDAGAHAIKDCGYWDHKDCSAAVIAAVERAIRADERATIKYEMGVLQRDGLRLRQERADLRAKVEALPGANDIWLYREDVLALIDGSSE